MWRNVLQLGRGMPRRRTSERLEKLQGAMPAPLGLADAWRGIMMNAPEYRRGTDAKLNVSMLASS